jgi:hypothetical protein
MQGIFTYVFHTFSVSNVCLYASLAWLKSGFANKMGYDGSIDERILSRKGYLSRMDGQGGGSWWFMVVHGGVSEHPVRECSIHVGLRKLRWWRYLPTEGIERHGENLGGMVSAGLGRFIVVARGIFCGASRCDGPIGGRKCASGL